MCPEGPKEAAKVLLNSEVALLPKGLHHQGPLLTTVKQADTPEMLRMLSFNITKKRAVSKNNFLRSFSSFN